MGKRTLGTLNGGKPTVFWKNKAVSQSSPAWREIDKTKLDLITCPECKMPRRKDAFAVGFRWCKYCQTKRMRESKKRLQPPAPALPSDNPATWFCNKCERTLPLSADYFFRDASKPTGLRTNCKDCTMGRTVRKPSDVSTEVWEAIPTRACTKCGKRYPATTDYFHAKKASPGGIVTQCKACRNKANRKYKKVVTTSEPQRLCEWCGKTKPPTREYFYLGSIKDGKRTLDIRCITCRLKRQKAIRAGKAIRMRGTQRHIKRISLWRRIWRYLMGHKVV